MGFFSWIIFGLIAGGLAKLIMPGDQKGGCLLTMLLGMAGALIGGWIGTLLGFGSVTQFDIRSMAIAIVGALVLLGALRLFKGSR